MTQTTQITGTAAEELKIETQTEHLDLAIAEVFQLMMGVACLPETPSAPPLNGSVNTSVNGSGVATVGPGGTTVVTAVVGLAGALSGACVLRMPEPTALKMASLLAGEPMTVFDRTVKDALGEACNMLAGTWKGRQGTLSPTCMLSVPAVISGSHYEFHLPKPAFHLERAYVFAGYRFTFCVDCLGL